MILIVCDYTSPRTGAIARYIADITGQAPIEHGCDDPGHVVGMEHPNATGTWFVYVGF